MVGLVMVGRTLRSRRLYENLVMAAIGLRALREINKQNRESMLASLAAWNRRQMQRLEHGAQHEARAVKSAGHRVQAGSPDRRYDDGN